MAATGHSLIKAKLAEMGAPLAGEMSGHIFFADGYYGFDDAVYVAVRLLDILSRARHSLAEMRDQLVAQGVTINGLVILSETPLAWNPDHTNPQGGLDNYYRSHVVGGTGAFVIVAENFASFGQAIIKKLIAEIASSGPAQVRHASVR